MAGSAGERGELCSLQQLFRKEQHSCAVGLHSHVFVTMLLDHVCGTVHFRSRQKALQTDTEDSITHVDAGGQPRWSVCTEQL